MYKITGNIFLLHVLMFTFWIADCKTKVSTTNEKQAFPLFNLLLISSLMQLFFVSIVRKYVN